MSIESAKRPTFDEVPVVLNNIVKDLKASGIESINHQKRAILSDKENIHSANREVNAENKSLENLSDLKIDGFKFLEKVGEGGMGTVYLAEQLKPVNRHVAIKIIKKQLVDKNSRGRFESESQAMALMSHENIAAVLGAGKTERNQPYLIMEYFPGQALNTYCDEKCLTIKDRVKLFIKVCDGIIHAHQKGIIHRDINPSNILVIAKGTSHSMLKIIDFGLAKSMFGKLTEKTMYTQIGGFLGTLKYSSPEQIAGKKSIIDMRSDVYSLGVVLYELLSGLLPLDSKTYNTSSPFDLVNQLTEISLPEPFNRISNFSEKEQNSIAIKRSQTIKEIKNSLRKELTWIIFKCIDADPSQRYTSVGELKTDLQNWLQNLPVSARKTGNIYKIKKFISRNRLLALSGTAFTVVLIISTFFSLIKYRLATMALNELEAMSDFQAQQLNLIKPAILRDSLDAQIAEQLAAKDLKEAEKQQLQGLFNEVNTMDISLKHVDQLIYQPSLDLIEDNFSNNQTTQLKLLKVLANSSTEMSLNQRAKSIWLRIIALSVKFYGEESTKTLNHQLKLAETEVSLGNLIEAKKLTQNVRQTLLDNFGKNHKDSLSASTLLAQIYKDQGEYKAAQKLLLESYEGLKQIHGDGSPELFEVLRLTGSVLHFLGKNDEAIKNFKLVFEISEKEFGLEHRNTIKALRNLGWIYSYVDEDEALKYINQALRHAEKVFGSSDSFTLGIMNLKAVTLAEVEKYDEAKTIMTEIVSRAEVSSQEGKGNPRYHRFQMNLAWVYMGLGLYDQSQPILESTYEQLRESLGPKNSLSLSAGFNFICNEYLRGNLKGLDKRVEEHLNNHIETYGDFNIETIKLKLLMSEVYLSIGQYDQSLTLINAVIDFYKDSGNQSELQYLNANVLLAQIKHIQKNHDEAESIYLNLYELTQENSSLTSSFRANVMHMHARLLFDVGLKDEALKKLQTSKYMYLETFKDDHPHVLSVTADLLRIQLEEDINGEAFEQLKSIIKTQHQTLGKFHPHSLRSRYYCLSFEQSVDENSIKNKLDELKEDAFFVFGNHESPLSEMILKLY